MWVVFLFTIIYSMSGHVLNYIYIETRKKYFPNQLQSTTKLNDSEVAMHSVMIKNLPEDRSGKVLAEFVRDITEDYKKKKEDLNSRADPYEVNAIEIFINSFG